MPAGHRFFDGCAACDAACEGWRGRLLLRNALVTNICSLMLEGNGLADSAAALVSQIQVRSASHQGELAEPGSCDPTGAVRHYRARTSVLESLLIPLVQGLEGRAAEVQKESGSDLDELQVSAEDAGSDDDSEADSYSEDFALEDSSEDSSVSSEVNGAGSDVNADGDESEDSAGELWPRFSAGGPTVCAGCGAEDCDVCTQAKVVWRCMMKEADTLAETLAQDLDEGLAQCNGLRGGAKRKAPDPNNAPAATLRAAPAGAAAVAGVPAGAAVGAAAMASVAAAPEDAQPAPGIVLGLRPPDATSFSVSQAAQRRLLAAGTLGRFAVQQRLGFQRVQPTGSPADAVAVDIALEEPPAAVESAAVGPAAPAPAAADAPPPVVALVPFDIGVVEPMSAPQVQRLEREKMQKERARAREKERESEREREIREGWERVKERERTSSALFRFFFVLVGGQVATAVGRVDELSRELALVRVFAQLVLVVLLRSRLNAKRRTTKTPWYWHGLLLRCTGACLTCCVLARCE